MEFGGLDCRGNETSLHECSVSSRFVELWSRLIFSNHRRYSGVRCIHKVTGMSQFSVKKKLPCTVKMATLLPFLHNFLQ